MTRVRTVTLAAAVVAMSVTGLGLATAPAAGAAVVPGTYAVTGSGSGKCVDARSAASANATAVQQYTCNGSTAQQWVFTAVDSGYFQIGTAAAPSQVWDVTNVSTADSAPIQLWAYGGTGNQQWQPVDEGNGRYHFINRNSGKCLDVPNASTADSVQLQQYTCNASAAQSFSLNGGGGTTPPPPPGTPDFGPNVTVFDPTMSASTIQSKLTSVFNAQQSAQFGTARTALLFKPGTYNVDANLGFYEQVAGLGLTPGQVTINGQVHVEADWQSGNATLNFWRDAEGLTINPPGGTNTWAVSQADPLRRVQVNGNLKLDDGGWSSGGFLADSRVTGQVQSGTQQQWLSRNDQIGSWTGQNWNMVFSGVQGAPAANSFPNPPYTALTQSPVIAEKPYLYVDGAGAYNVFVPALRTNSSGTSWANGNPAGTSLPISQFYIVKPGDSASTINAQLAAGKNLLVTPGIYHLNQTLNITRPDTVVLGMGIATFVPDNGITAISTSDVNGVRIAGLLIDAGTTNSPVLMRVGPTGSSADHSADPTVLSDVNFRIGGATVGKATQSLVINSNNTITDDTWLWRADHGNGGTVGWTTNTAQNGLVVNGNNVTAYGLFAEHYQQYQTIWNGNGGKTIFYQSEMPYDPPNQASYMNGSTQGWASYKVGNSVTSHEAWGLGVYCLFLNDASIHNERAIEVPNTSGVRFHNMVSVMLGSNAGTITHVINSTGAAAGPGHTVTDLVSYP
ncbi:MAG: hypothetical protein QOI21_2979 [Actinomycetota bacterium]|nr:hypothetical protein [Actinomycetota bacterium]